MPPSTGVVFLFLLQADCMPPSVALPHGIAQTLCINQTMSLRFCFFLFESPQQHTHRWTVQYLEDCYLAWRLFWRKPTDYKWETLNLIHKTIILWFLKGEICNSYIKVHFYHMIMSWRSESHANTKLNVFHRLPVYYIYSLLQCKHAYIFDYVMCV